MYIITDTICNIYEEGKNEREIDFKELAYVIVGPGNS